MWMRSNKRFFSVCNVLLKEPIISLKGRKKSSQEWLIRQFKDPYVEKAKLQNYRSRSAFKLIEMHQKHKILFPGCTVVDCGASPGGWSQVAARFSNADQKDSDAEVGAVIGIDLIRIHPIPGTILLSPMDFTLPSSQEKLRQVLNGKPVDVFLSDMAPNATGLQNLDHDCIINLLYQAFRFSLEVSRPGGTFLGKIWNGGEMQTLIQEFGRFYKKVQIVKPLASRKDSAEIYILGKDFKGLER